MSNVFYLKMITKLDISVDRVAEMADKAKLEGVVVLGYTKEGEEYLASSYADRATVLWLMERLKKQLLEVNADE